MKKSLFQFKHMLACGTLLQQFVLDMFAIDQAMKLSYEKHRLSSRIAPAQEVQQAAAIGAGAQTIGRQFESSAFTGSRAYYNLHKRKALVLLAR